MVRRASVSALVDPRTVTVLPDRAAKSASGEGVRVLSTTEPLVDGTVLESRPLIVRDHFASASVGDGKVID